MTENLSELFDRYVAGSLPDAERTAFEARLDSDADFRRAFEAESALLAALHATADEQMLQRVRRVLAETPPPPPPWWNRLIAWKIAVLVAALAFVAGGGAGWWSRGNMKEQQRPDGGNQHTDSTEYAGKERPIDLNVSIPAVGENGYPILSGTDFPPGSAIPRLRFVLDRGAAHEREYLCSDTLLQVFIKSESDRFWEGKQISISGPPTDLMLLIGAQRFPIINDKGTHPLIE